MAKKKSKKKAKKSKKKAPKTPKKTCRTCGEKKPENEENFAKMSPVVAVRTGENFMPDCRQCRAYTPLIKSTAKLVLENSPMTAQKLSEITGVERKSCAVRLAAAFNKGAIDRLSMGVYAPNEMTHEMDLSGISIESFTSSRAAAKSTNKPQLTKPNLTANSARGLRLINMVLKGDRLEDEDRDLLEIARDLIENPGNNQHQNQEAGVDDLYVLGVLED